MLLYYRFKFCHHCKLRGEICVILLNMKEALFRYCNLADCHNVIQMQNVHNSSHITFKLLA